MRKLLLISAIAIILGSVTGCASAYDKLLSSNDTEAKYKAAFEYFNEGKYNKSAQMFESLKLATKGTAREDTVLYNLALSNYKFGDYITAESNFNQFILVFPRSSLTEEVRYLLIDCLYKGTYRYELDQTPTYKTLSEINKFLKEFPDTEYKETCAAIQKDLNERLDKKAFEGARLYYHMEDYLAAHYAMKNVLKEDADNVYREDVLYFTAMSAYKYAANSVPDKKHERYLVFVDDYYNFVSEFPESKYRHELDGIYESVNKIIKKTE